MSEAQSLIAEAKDLVAKAEKDVVEVVESVDVTHLRLAVQRLVMFLEHVATRSAAKSEAADVEPEQPAEPEPDDEKPKAAPKRTASKPKA